MRNLSLYTGVGAGLTAAIPAQAASGPFFSLANTDFTVLIAFLLFVGVLLKFKVPAMLTGLLDKRSADIQKDLDTARQLREDAKTLLASYERKSREVKSQVERIIASAGEDARLAADAAQEELKQSIARRLQAAEDQIASAEASAVREVRDRAVVVAIAAAGDILAKQMTPEAAGVLVEASIAEVGAKLH